MKSSQSLLLVSLCQHVYEGVLLSSTSGNVSFNIMQWKKRVPVELVNAFSMPIQYVTFSLPEGKAIKFLIWVVKQNTNPQRECLQVGPDLRVLSTNLSTSTGFFPLYFFYCWVDIHTFKVHATTSGFMSEIRFLWALQG